MYFPHITRTSSQAPAEAREAAVKSSTPSPRTLAAFCNVKEQSFTDELFGSCDNVQLLSEVCMNHNFCETEDVTPQEVIAAVKFAYAGSPKVPITRMDILTIIM
jgi:hypothetical protein